ncbi:MAG: DUF2399 domain-containing protein [Burkholderiales bacterium]|nr:DUF2399 domain-containing protein [Burkholderiales bacterium]
MRCLSALIGIQPHVSHESCPGVAQWRRACTVRSARGDGRHLARRGWRQRALTGAPGTSCTSTRACGVQPWRFNLGDYSATFIDAPHTQRDLAGDPVAASWDAALAPAMQRHGLAIAEEALAASLLADLQP